MFAEGEADLRAKPSAQIRVLVVMGVSGSGKSTIAEDLARALGWVFQEGDDLHPPANIEKMRGGAPLTDEDRWPWLRRVAQTIDAWRATNTKGVIACSALKRAYRTLIIGERADVRLAYLEGSYDLIAARLAQRRGHYMPASLLKSQFAALEPPAPDERAIVVDINQSISAIEAEVLAALG
jgi:carbohydrate kinase (thermoresistant glucokinase family)